MKERNWRRATAECESGLLLWSETAKHSTGFHGDSKVLFIHRLMHLLIPPILSKLKNVAIINLFVFESFQQQ